jgi:hypothetical protein
MSMTTCGDCGQQHVCHVGPNRVTQHDKDNWTAVDSDNTVVAIATRNGPGCLWYVWVRAYEHHRRLSRSETVHVRVSGKLPEAVQTRFLHAILENA